MRYTAVLLASLISLNAYGGVSEGRQAFNRGDYAHALEEWRPLAERGNAAAQTNLGVMYVTGKGVHQDYREARMWFFRAAEQGHAEAQYELALMYANGEGVAVDYFEAMRWYRLAAAQGHRMAQNNLGVLYGEGKGINLNLAQAIYWQAKASQQGSMLAQKNLEDNLSQLVEMTVAKPRVNVRARSSTSAKIVTRLREGMSVWILDASERWYQVYCPDGHKIGWISASLLVRAKDKKRIELEPLPQIR